MKKNRILLTCAKGITPFLREELLQLGFPVLSETIAGIATERGYRKIPLTAPMQETLAAEPAEKTS